MELTTPISPYLRNFDQDALDFIKLIEEKFKEGQYETCDEFYKMRLYPDNALSEKIVDFIEEKYLNVGWHHVTFNQNYSQKDGIDVEIKFYI